MKRKSESGQALTEYVLLLLVVIGVVSALFSRMPKLLVQLETPLKKDLKHTYKYGDPQACGDDDSDDLCTGEPKRHPRYNIAGNDNFRLFGRK